MDAPQPQTRPALSPGAKSAAWMQTASVLLLGVAILYRPMVCGRPYALASTTAFALLILAAAVFRLSGGCARGQLLFRFGSAGTALALFCALSMVSAARAANWFAGMEWTLVLLTYALTAFLVLQAGREAGVMRFYLSCLLATAAALAAYAAWHHAFEMPALASLNRQNPDAFGLLAGTGRALSNDLGKRILAGRAYGSFVTPNQLASLMIMALFPMGALALAAFGVREYVRGAFCAILAAGMVAVLLLTGSRGGMLAFAFGVGLFGVFAVVKARLSRKTVLAVGAICGVLAVAFVSTSNRFLDRGTASLTVRLQYWRTAADMVAGRPALGIGPGNWTEWYAMLKAPGYEETRTAHSMYVQAAAETGLLGLAAFALVWVAVLAPAVRALWRERRHGSRQSVGDSRRDLVMAVGGPLLAALALAFDYFMLGSFLPVPAGGPDWLRGAPFLPYAIVGMVWLIAFRVVHGCRPDAWLTAGVLAGLGAFLAHGAVEFTLVVPALGGSAAVLAGVLVGRTNRPVPHRWRIPRLLGVGLTLGGFAVLFGWTHLAVLPAASRLVHRQAVDRLYLQAPDGLSSRDASAALEHYQRICELVPYDDAGWRHLAEELLALAESGKAPTARSVALGAIKRAQQLNPLNAENWLVQGRAYAGLGRLNEAADAYRRAAELHPSLPRSWYRYAETAERADIGRRRVCAAYRLALALMAKQHHARSRVLGPPLELIRAWSRLRGVEPQEMLLETWRDAWDAGDRAQPWEALSTEEKRGFVIGESGGSMEKLWQAAGPDGRTALLVAAGLQTSPEEGLPEVRVPAAEADVEALTAGLPGGDKLLSRWDELTHERREREFWSIAGGGLWERLLSARVRACE